MSTLVIGYGNTLRSDDGLGPFVAAAIARQAWPNVRTLCLHQLTPELAEMMAGAERIIFVDASCVAQARPVEVQQLHPASDSRPESHGSDPAVLLTLARQLFGQAPPAWLVRIQGENYCLGEVLSYNARQNGMEAVQVIQTLLFGCAPSNPE